MHKATRLAIIADDLSSATDCGIQIAQGGLRTIVPLGGYRLPADCGEVDVISVDTDSRSVNAQDAYRVARLATRALVEAGCDGMFKSVDSTLRGNLGAEIDGVLDASGIGCAVVAPAYPLYGRTTVGGRHFVNGTPIDQTEFGSDPQCPVRESDIVKLLASQSKRKVERVALDVLRGGEAAVAEALTRFRGSGTGLVAFDVEAEEDLDRLGQAVGAIGSRVLWVGSTGMARVIPAALRMQPVKPAPFELISSCTQVMVVAGSVSEVTREQLLEFDNTRGVTLTKMNPLVCVVGGEDLETELDRCHSELVNGAEAGHDVVFHVSSTREEVNATQAIGREQSLSEQQVSGLIASCLARVARDVLDACVLRGVVLTGGDTAKAVCEALGAEAIRMLGAVAPGIPLGLLLGAREMLIVTKAGGFGSKNALIASVEKVRNT